MRVVSIPCLSDNYAYLVIAGQGGAGDSAAIVDPSAAQPVLDAIARREHFSRSQVRSVLDELRRREK